MDDKLIRKYRKRAIPWREFGPAPKFIFLINQHFPFEDV